MVLYWRRLNSPLFLTLWNNIERSGRKCWIGLAGFNGLSGTLRDIATIFCLFGRSKLYYFQGYMYFGNSYILYIRIGNILQIFQPHGRRKVHDYFYYCPVNHQFGLQRNTFSKLSYIFLIHQNVPHIMSFHLRYMMVW